MKNSFGINEDLTNRSNRRRGATLEFIVKYHKTIAQTGKKIQLYVDRARRFFHSRNYLKTQKHKKSKIKTSPNGAWYKDTSRGFIVGGTTRHLVAAFFFVPFSFVWLKVVGGIYVGQIIQGEFDILLSLFGIPFLLFAPFVLYPALIFVMGKKEILVNGEKGCIFEGIGFLGFKEDTFSWREIIRIKAGIDYPDEDSELAPANVIILQTDTGKEIKFKGLRKDRLDFIESVLRSKLKNKSSIEPYVSQDSS